MGFRRSKQMDRRKKLNAKVGKASAHAVARTLSAAPSGRCCPAASASASPSAAPSCANRKLFLFDEPLSNLDAALRVNTRSRSPGCIAA
jgi:ABC-type sugar transport system ATPase subunit